MKFRTRKLKLKTKIAFSLVEISIALIIIGILIIGITQAIEMFSEASLKSARNLSKSSRISRVNDLSLWLDATSDKAFEKEKDDNSIISIWKDTNPRSSAQIATNSSISSLYPTYILSEINGLPVANFKKSSNNCMTISSQSFFNNSEDFTLYLIFSPNTLDDGVIIEKNNSTATTFPFSLELANGYYKFNVKNSSSTLSVLGSKKAKIKTPNLIRLSRIKGSQIEIMINDISLSQVDNLTSSTFNNSELSIGCRNGATPSNFINGNIGEIAFFDRNLNVKEKNEIEEYFYKKWKMKKYEGALAVSELPCAVPSSANTISTITSVQSTTSPQDISCKIGYSGSPKYTCINGTFNIDSGSCILSSCVVSDCVSENFQGQAAVPEITCFNLKNAIGSTVPINATGTYLTKEYYNGNDRQNPPATPNYGFNWKCKSDGSMIIDIEKGCYPKMEPYVYVPPNKTHATNYWSSDGIQFYYTAYIGTAYCCSGLLKNSYCNWATLP